MTAKPSSLELAENYADSIVSSGHPMHRSAKLAFLAGRSSLADEVKALREELERMRLVALVSYSDGVSDGESGNYESSEEQRLEVEHAKEVLARFKEVMG